MRLLGFIVLAGVLTGCGNSEEAQFTASCESFAEAQPSRFGNDPKAECACVYQAVSGKLSKDQMTIALEMLRAASTPETEAIETWTTEGIDEVGNIIEAGADSCGLT